MKKTFSGLSDMAIGFVGNMAKSAAIGGAVWAGERLIENAYEGYTGKDVKWTIDKSTFGVAIVDPERYLEVDDRYGSSKKNNVELSAGVHTNIVELDDNQNIVGVSIDDDVYGISKNELDSMAMGVVDTLKDAFSSEDKFVPTTDVLMDQPNDDSTSNSYRESADSFIDYGDNGCIIEGMDMDG